MRDLISNFPWHVLYASAIMLAFVGAVTIVLIFMRMLRRRGIALLRVTDGALDPSSVQTVLLAFASVVGSLWIAYETAVTGAHEFSAYQLERTRLLDTPSLSIEMSVDVLGDGSDLHWPVEVTVQTQNIGARKVPLDLIAVPMLSIIAIDDAPISLAGNVATPTLLEKISHLPNLKIECTQRMPEFDETWRPSCDLRNWSRAELEPGGVGYYSFLHPALPRGTYLAQFSLVIDPNLLVGEFDPNRPVLWTRSKYFVVP